MGERVRSLRRSAGLSQEELAAGRFSKEYVSQIERGKTRPTAETLEWLADRLATDREFLEHGLTLADSQRLEAALVDAERILEDARYGDALKAFADVRALAGASPAPTVSLQTAPRRGVGAHPSRGAPCGDGAARAGGHAGRGRRVHRRRPRRDRVPGRRRPLLRVEHQRGDRPLRPGAPAGGELRPVRRSPALRHPPLARTVSSAQPRLVRRPGGHRARAGAG